MIPRWRPTPLWNGGGGGDALVCRNLHVLDGQKRGGKSRPDHRSRLMEEVDGEATVLAQAEALHLTPERVDELRRVRQRYLDALLDTYTIHYP